MVLEDLSRSIGFAVRIEARHNPSNLAPVGTFRIRIEHAHMGDRMLLIVRGKRGMGVLDRRRQDQGEAWGRFRVGKCLICAARRDLEGIPATAAAAALASYPEATSTDRGPLELCLIPSSWCDRGLPNRASHRTRQHL